MHQFFVALGLAAAALPAAVARPCASDTRTAPT